MSRVIRLHDDTFARLIALAQEWNLSVSATIERLVDNYERTRHGCIHDVIAFGKEL